MLHMGYEKGQGRPRTSRAHGSRMAAPSWENCTSSRHAVLRRAEHTSQLHVPSHIILTTFRLTSWKKEDIHHHWSITQPCHQHQKLVKGARSHALSCLPPCPSQSPLGPPPPAYTPIKTLSNRFNAALPSLPRFSGLLDKVKWDSPDYWTKMANPPRMLILDGGAGGEAFVTLPTTYDVSLFLLIFSHRPNIHLSP